MRRLEDLLAESARHTRGCDGTVRPTHSCRSGWKWIGVKPAGRRRAWRRSTSTPSHSCGGRTATLRRPPTTCNGEEARKWSCDGSAKISSVGRRAARIYWIRRSESARRDRRRLLVAVL